MVIETVCTYAHVRIRAAIGYELGLLLLNTAIG